MATREELNTLTKIINKRLGATIDYYHVRKCGSSFIMVDETGREYLNAKSKTQMYQLLGAFIDGMQIMSANKEATNGS